MNRYLIVANWHSGLLAYYCALAETHEQALALVANGRESAIQASFAFEWPAHLGGPVPRDPSVARAFRLKHQGTIDAALTALNVAREQTKPERPGTEAAIRPAARCA